MLEVKNLKRIYRMKGANSVYALNDVSLKFPETGLVFILGKSGSGKSTLLNVMGGLDNADEGEIIINGKSSKDFTKGEMDSYRNTYLGFIFQEYNILSDFTVKENIALALELQHKKATDDEVNRILEEVDLAGYGKRKPNELSGGQKQRVAIARALVKEPKIIFGDEPTGALDSNTGKQVFETLKKLSKSKLVVIVSHDRDFAEHFGDRVIELKDGKVISDITKECMHSASPVSGISLIGDNIIRLDKNRPLTASDLPLINQAIAHSESSVFITADPHVNEALCEAAKIDKNGNREEFVTTDPSKIKTKQGSFAPIKSKFSLSRAFKMGARSLKVKPFRLVLTIILSTVSFTLFGSSLTLYMFNRKDAMKSSIEKNDITSLFFYVNENKNGDGLSQNKIKEIENTGVKFYTASSEATQLNVPSNSSSERDIFHISVAQNAIAIQDSILNDFGFSVVKGRLPNNEYECAITLYEYYSYKDLGIGKDKEQSTYIAPEDVDYDKVIGTTVLSSDSSSYRMSSPKNRTIVGIVDTKLPEKLMKYRDGGKEINYNDPNLQELLYLSSSSSIHSTLFVSKIEKHNDYYTFPTSLEIGSDGSLSYTIGSYPLKQGSCFYLDEHKTSLEKGEAIVPLRNVLSYFNSSLTGEGSLKYALSTIRSEYNNIRSSYIDNHFRAIYEKYKNSYSFSVQDPSDEEALKTAVSSFLFGYPYGQGTKEYKDFIATWNEKETEILNGVTEELDFIPVTGTLPTGEISDDHSAIAINPEQYTFKIVGLDLNEISNCEVNISKEDAKEIQEKLADNGYVTSIGNEQERGVVAFAQNKVAADRFLDLYLAKQKAYSEELKKSDAVPDGMWYIRINNYTIQSVETTASFVLVLTHVFLYVGIALAAFSMLLFYNFISISINNKKREIGILRAVGAKRADVFKIFYSEAFIIAMINALLSIIAVFAISFSINSSISENPLFNFDLMNPNILTILALLGISLLASVISSFLPVTRIANKKPIDAIQNR